MNSSSKNFPMIKAPRLQAQALWLPWLLLLLHLFLTISASPSPLTSLPKLGVLRGIHNFQNVTKNLASEPNADLKTFYYNQTLDHFNYRPESYVTFQQRYVMNFRHWGGRRVAAPILAYLGEESDLDGDLRSIGWLTDNAKRFKALQVYIEVRRELGREINSLINFNVLAKL